MGYRIEYEKIGKISQRTEKRWTGVLMGTLVIVLVLGAIAVKTVGLEWVQEVLLPGDPDVTAAALEGMVEDLRSGEGIAEAFKAFCQEIIKNAAPE